MWTARSAVPPALSCGEIVEIRTLTQHAMETGFSYDHLGQLVPRDILSRFVCKLDGKEVFRAELFPSTAAKPYLSFTLRAHAPGDLELTWTDDDGRSHSERARLEVS